MSSRSDAANARAQVYLGLADALAEPYSDLPGVLTEAVAAGSAVADSPACQAAAPAVHAAQSLSVDALRVAYRTVVYGTSGRPPAFYESLHRQGRLAGEATAAVASCYQLLGVVPAAGELPDHASVELAFLGELASGEAEALAAGDHELTARLRSTQRSFLCDHAMTWLPALGAQLQATNIPFYAPVGGLLRDFLHEEQTRRESTSPLRRTWPVLPTADACTLCGLCTGACPTDALWIAEDGLATSLVLDPARCTGCRRCVRTCPEHVLEMAHAADREATAHAISRQLLATSTRATCPRCGQPTVSQAELQAVFRLLQPDPAMQYRFRLCVTCKSMS